ncbi:MAG: hypothetical protein ACKVZ0_04680 [Gemmatimonadales bacterium]
MLFRAEFLKGIQDGAVTLAFRRWRRPSVRAGGTLLTPVGELAIGSIAVVDPKRIFESEARQAGYPALQVLLDELASRADGDVYRVELAGLRPDPRVALREAPPPTEAETREVCDRLRRLDARAAEPWTRRTLELIARLPATRAGNLCRLVGLEMHPFKLNVRKLKALGLTESLEVGYRLSPRGEAVLGTLASRRETG